MDNYTPEYSLKNIPFPSYYGFRLANNRLLDSFKTNLFKLIKMVKFKKVRNNFQMKLSQNIKEVKTCNYIWVTSDK